MPTYREQVELCVDILERIVLALSPEQLAQNYRAALHAGLNHPHEKVKILALTQVGHYTHTHSPGHSKTHGQVLYYPESVFCHW